MRFVYLLIALILIPALTVYIRQNPRHVPKIWFAFGVLSWLNTPLHLFFNLLPGWNMWPGYVKGLEFSILDVIAIALIASGIGKGDKIRFKVGFSIYLAIVASSMLVSTFATAAFMYAWQLCRMGLVAVAIMRSCRDPRAPRAVLAGLIVGLVINVVSAVVARSQGAIQSGGLIEHQNMLGMMSHFVAFPALALMLAGERNKLYWLGPLAGLGTMIVAASRATFGLAIAAYALLFLLSALQGWTSRKTLAIVVALMAVLAAVPLTLHSLDSRFEAQKSIVTGTYDERAAFTRAAELMIADHPFGVGANQYVLQANMGGYSERAGVVWNSGSRAANVHNVYLLMAAETGWLGALAFIALLINAQQTAFRTAWGRGRDLPAQQLLGLGVAMLTVAVHSMFEWITIDFTPQYLMAVSFGLIGGLANQVARSRTSPKREANRATVRPAQGAVALS